MAKLRLDSLVQLRNSSPWGLPLPMLCFEEQKQRHVRFFMKVVTGFTWGWVVGLAHGGFFLDVGMWGKKRAD